MGSRNEQHVLYEIPIVSEVIEWGKQQTFPILLDVTNGDKTGSN